MAALWNLYRLLLVFPLLVYGRVWQIDQQPNLQVVIQGTNNDIQWFVGNESAPDHFKILLTEGDSIMVGARNMVYNISLATLAQNSKLEWYSRDFTVDVCKDRQKSDEQCQNYIRVLVKKSADQYFVCGTNAFKPWCRTYKQEGLDYRIADRNGVGEDGHGKCPWGPNHNSTTVYTDGQLYSATVSDVLERDALIFRDSMIRTQQSDSIWLNEPSFVNSMAHDDKVYFFFRETSIENTNCGKTVFSRVARVCKQDQGGGDILLNGIWTSFLKARLNCSIPGEFPFYFDEIQSTSELGKGNYMSTYDSGNRTDIVYGIFTTAVNSISGSAVCAFRMFDVAEAFRGQFKGQQDADSNWLPVDEKLVPSYEMDKCVNNTMALLPSRLNFVKLHPLMESAVPTVGGAPLLVQSHLGARFTQIAIDWQVLAADNRYYDVMFVGTDDGRVIKAINKGRGAQIESVIIEEIQVFKTQESITSLKVYRKPELGIEKLVVLSDDNIVSVPLHRCHERKSCSGCVSLQDPYCSWADDECSNSNRGLQSILTGKHSYCKDTESSSAPTTTTSTTTTTTKISPPTCPPPSKCVCPSEPINNPASLPGGGGRTRVLLNTTTPADVSNVVTPDRGRSNGDHDLNNERTNQISHEEPVVGSWTDGEKVYKASTLAVGIVVAIVGSMIVGFGTGYMVSQCRRPPNNNMDSLARDRKLPPIPAMPNLRKSQNHLDDYIGQSDPNLYQNKQLNVVLNVTPKSSNKLPNSSAETKPAHKSNKVYL